MADYKVRCATDNRICRFKFAILDPTRKNVVAFVACKSTDGKKTTYRSTQFRHYGHFPVPVYWVRTLKDLDSIVEKVAIMAGSIPRAPDDGTVDFLAQFEDPK